MDPGSQPTGGNRKTHAAVGRDGRIYVFGSGAERCAPLPVYAYSPATDTWARVANSVPAVDQMGVDAATESGGNVLALEPSGADAASECTYSPTVSDKSDWGGFMFAYSPT